MFHLVKSLRGAVEKGHPIESWVNMTIARYEYLCIFAEDMKVYFANNPDAKSFERTIEFSESMGEGFSKAELVYSKVYTVTFNWICINEQFYERTMFANQQF